MNLTQFKQYYSSFLGRDLVQGGTWFGITKTGKIGMITNYREAESKVQGNPISRGLIVSHFLQFVIYCLLLMFFCDKCLSFLFLFFTNDSLLIETRKSMQKIILILFMNKDIVMKDFIAFLEM
jgi:hypothetical protein